MAEEQGGFSIWYAMPIVFILVLVFMLKKDETKHLTGGRSEEHTSNSSHITISYAVFCLKKKKKKWNWRSLLPYENTSMHNSP